MAGQVTNLSQYVLDFINAVKRRPALGSDPSELDNLEQAALTSFQGAFGALNAPIAPMTWEARTQFLGTQAVSERIQLDIPFPCMLVGAFASISTIGAVGIPGSGTQAPTRDDIDVTIDLNSHEYMTQVQGTTTPVVGGQLQRDGTFTTLAAVSINNGGRLLCWVIPYRTAQLGVTFRWKQGANVFQTSHVGLSFYARALQEQ
jgi:hypothetical protein